MYKKTEAQMEKARIAKVTRAIVRMKHSLAADREINDILPDTLDAFDSALQAGEIKRLQVSLNDVLNES